jgi:hypothetical protein
MAKKYNNQIKAGSGFSLSGEYPIDDRTVVAQFSDLAGLVTSHYAYEGMQVYVIADKKTYEYKNTSSTGTPTLEWKAIAYEDTINGLDFTSPAASGNTISFIDTVSQTDGKINATKKTITSASTSTAGIVKLSSTVSSTAEDVAATPKGVQAAINTLDFSDPTVPTSGTTTAVAFIDSVSQINGKIAATKKNLPLSSAIDSDSETEAATPKAVKSAYDDLNGKIAEANSAIGAIKTTDEDITLKTDLFTFTNIGKITGASNTNPIKVADAGDNLKAVFNKVFGTQQDQQPNISTSSVALNVSAGTTSYGGGEFGTAVVATDVTITFTLANSGTAGYGYRCGDALTTGSQKFYYPVTKQNGADLKIILPSGKTASSDMVTAGTFKSASSNILYCDFNNNKQVSIKINLPAGSVSTSSQIRYEQISASVTLGAAQKEDQLTAGTAITKFLTYLKKDATSTAALSGSTKSNTAGAYTISAGSYSPYYLASTSSSLTSVAKNVATKYTTGSAVSITCAQASYIWFLLPPNTTGNKTIQYEALGQWYEFPGGTAAPVDVSLVLNSGVTVTYKGYRTNKQAAAGTTSFKI